MIVVAVIGIISILAVPNFMRSRLFANETSAIASLRVIVTSEITYASTAGNGSFGSTDELVAQGLIDTALGSGTKDGYNLTLTPDGSSGFTIIAVPVTVGTTGQRGFYSDQTGVIRYSDDGSVPTAASPALGTEAAEEEPEE
jgi:type II secretory pathway pseudopilin PulG